MIEVNKECIHKEIITQWFTTWEQLAEALHAAHSERDKQTTATLMAKGIAQYEQLLIDSAATAATLDDDFELYPINGKERLSFIKARPAQFASYRQLDELYKETKKRAARLQLKK